MKSIYSHRGQHLDGGRNRSDIPASSIAHPCEAEASKRRQWMAAPARAAWKRGGIGASVASLG